MVLRVMAWFYLSVVVQVSTQDSQLRMRSLAKAFGVRDQLPESDENTTLDCEAFQSRWFPIRMAGANLLVQVNGSIGGVEVEVEELGNERHATAVKHLDIREILATKTVREI